MRFFSILLRLYRPELAPIMADLRKAMTTLVECPICLEPLTDPRILSCLHTLCYECLNGHIEHFGKDGSFQCPVCREYMVTLSGGADTFPKNFFINQHMAILSDTGTGARSKTRKTTNGVEQPQQRPCSNSEEGDDCTPPEQFCLDCCEYLCKACFKAHRKSKASRSHVLIAVEDLTDELLWDAESKSETPKCQKHREDLKLYCITCSSAVCTVCCYTIHQTHKFEELTDRDERNMTELDEAVADLQSLVDKVHDRQHEIDRALETVEANTSSTISMATRAFQTFQHLLIQKTAEKVNKAKEPIEAKAGILTKNLTVDSQLIESMLCFVKDLMKKGNVFNRLASLPDVKSRLEQFQSMGESSDAALNLPSKTELMLTQLDELVVEEEVQLGETWSGPPLTVQFKCFFQDCQQDQVLLFLFLPPFLST